MCAQYRRGIITTMEAEAAKRQFLEYIEIERGRSVKTVENYDRYLTRSSSDGHRERERHQRGEYPRVPPLAEPSERHGRDSMKRRTQNYYLIALRAFLKFFRKRDIASISPERIELAKLPERASDLITAQRTRRLMKSPLDALAKKRIRTSGAPSCATAPFSSSSSPLGCAWRSSVASNATSTSRARTYRCAAKARRCVSSSSLPNRKRHHGLPEGAEDMEEALFVDGRADRRPASHHAASL